MNGYLEVLDRSREEMSDLAVKVFELSQTLREKWLTADYHCKRRILEIICLNFWLDDVTLCRVPRLIPETGARLCEPCASRQLSRTLYDSFGRSVLSTSYREGATDPVQATQPLFDSFGRTVGSRTYANAVIALAPDGSTSLAGVGEVLYSTSTTYNAKGQTVSSTDALGNVTNYEYDTLGRRTATIAPAVTIDGVAIRLRSETTYDSQGRTASTSLKKVAQTFLSVISTTVPTYDPFGNVVSTTVTALDGSGNSQSLTTSAVYDDQGRKLSETDAVNGTKSYFYDAQGRLVTVQLPALVGDGSQNPAPRPMYSYEYDPRGNRTKITDPNQNETIFAYDDQGRQLSRTLPDGSVETFVYDELGRQIRHVSFEGVVHTFEYDPATGRLASEQFFDNLAAFTAEDPHVTVERGYDAFGRDVEVALVDHVDSSNDRTGVRTFDALGRISSESGPEGTIRYEYDTFGKIIRTYTGSDANDPENDFRRTYDAFGRLDKITVWERNDVPLASNAREITDYDYDLLGNVAKVTKPNGVIETYQYDELSRLESLVNFAPDATPQDLSDNAKLAQFDYTYRADGKKVSESDTVWENGVAKTSSYQWTYDENGRLTDEVFTSFDELLSQTQHFQLDLAGNRIEQTLDLGSDATIDKTTEYDYDENDRLITETTGDEVTSYAYDHTQQVEKTVAENSVVQSVVTMGWSVRGLMDSVTVESYTSGSISKREKLSYGYDDEGIRVSVLTETDATANGSFESRIRTEYLVDRHNLTGYQQNIVETTTNADTNAEISKVVYTFGPQIISQTKFDAANPNGVTQVLQLDGHGSTRMLLSMAAAVVQSFQYDAYGNAIGFNPAQSQTNRLSNAELYNALTDSIYLRGREYGPSIARLYGLDPFTGDQFNPITFNKYLFGNSDGANNHDPNGRMSLGVTLAAGAILGGAVGGYGAALTNRNVFGGVVIGAAVGAAAFAGGWYAASSLSSLSAALGGGWGGGINALIAGIDVGTLLYAMQHIAYQAAENVQHGPPPSATLAAFDYDYAQLARDVYDDDPNLAAEVQAEGWTEDHNYSANFYGYHARLYKNTNPFRDEMVMVYEGTTFSSPADWANNAAQGFGWFGEGFQYSQAKIDAMDALQRASDANMTLRFAGHSLGGGLAAAAALHTNKEAITFNAAGVNSLTTNTSNAANLITNYRVRGEILSTLQDSRLFGRLMPNSSLGETYWLEPEAGMDIFSRHKMGSILQGMKALF